MDRGELRNFLSHLMFVEQPFHRDVALDPTVMGGEDGLAGWSDRPHMIIDESDAETDSLVRALELGYHGTSHKNCKGIVNGIANATTLADAGTSPSINKIKWSPLDFDLNGTSGYFLLRIMDIRS